MASPTTSFRTARRPYDRENPLPRRFKGVVAYDGTEYAGWQTQPSGRGVQDVLEARLSQLFGGRVHVAGSGRTDKGVHARHQTFHFEPPLEPDARKIPPHVARVIGASDSELAQVIQRTLTSLSSGLPKVVQVLSVEPAPESFHARESCSGKLKECPVCREAALMWMHVRDA